MKDPVLGAGDSIAVGNTVTHFAGWGWLWTINLGFSYASLQALMLSPAPQAGNVTPRKRLPSSESSTDREILLTQSRRSAEK
jgi:hypothetical protein